MKKLLTLCCIAASLLVVGCNRTADKGGADGSELYGYGADLRSLSGGLGEFSYEFSRYEQCPGDVQKREVEARASLLKGDEE